MQKYIIFPKGMKWLRLIDLCVSDSDTDSKNVIGRISDKNSYQDNEN